MGLAKAITTAGRRCGFTARSLGCLVFFLCLFSPALSANTSVFTDTRTCTNGWPNYCSDLSYFGLLSGTSNDLVTIGGGWTFNGGIGIGTTDELSSSGTNTATSIIDFADTVTSGTGNCGTVGSGTNFCTNGGTFTRPAGNPQTAATLVNSAESNLDNIIAKLLTYTAGNGTVTSLATSGYVDVDQGVSAGSLKIYRNTTNYNQSGALTIGCGAGVTCSADTLVLFHLSGSASFNFDITIDPTSGLTSDQVIFFINNNTLSFQPTAAATNVSGVFIMGNMGTTNRTLTVGCTAGNCDAVTAFGRFYNDNGAITFNSKGGSQDDDGFIQGPAPEPGTWALMGTGIGALLWGGWRKKKAAAAAAK